jgi:hypothetical protein
MELLFILLIVVVSTVWVGFDAAKHDWGKDGTQPASWVIGCILLWVLIFPAYLFARRRVPLKG